MKKLGIIAIAGMLLLTGCSANSDESFLESVGKHYPHLTTAKTGAPLIDTARSICRTLDNGGSAHMAAGVLEESGLSIGESATIVVAAVDHYCPEHDSAVR